MTFRKEFIFWWCSWANEIQIPVETGQNNLKTFDKVSNSANIKHTNCFYCNNPFTEELWCKECDPRRMIEGWTSGNNDIDKFIKDTIYKGRKYTFDRFLEWVPFDRFKDINQIGVENMSAEYLNELKIHWNCYKYASATSLEFYGMTKDPKTEEFMMILQFVDEGNLRSFLSHNFNNILWKDKIKYLDWLIFGLKALHELGYFHKDFHSGNILLRVSEHQTSISDFGLSGPSNKQKLDARICGVLPYIAPEVLNGESYTLSSDIYSFGKNPDAIYTSRLFTFNNLTKPINSSLITSYLDDEKNNKDGQDSQLFDLEVTSSLQLKDDTSDD
ncbi:kinase-like protein [Rhizophagus irregularis]|uniref:Kinase-like protein n=1 Tax=Rhizophagus irregularis TaxID=588596 RepID=A0A2I1H2F4_9GLOM|nr:kinase-like protein [Rhizophagus irregularis]